MSAHRSRRTRRLVVRATMAAGALVASGLVLVPGPAASADGLGGLTGSTGLPEMLATVVPSISGTGDVVGDNGYLCSSTAATGVTTTCPSIDLSSLLGLTSVSLAPQAPSGWTFSGWGGTCPDITSTGSCLVDSSLVGTLTGTLIEPVASFVPLLTGGGGGDAPAPDTRLSGGPRRNGWLRSDQVRLRVGSDQDGATFTCALDGTAVPCGPDLRLTGLPAGTHTVTAAAAVGDQTDATPARRTFTRPVNDLDLSHSRHWQERTGKRGYFLGTFSQTRAHGATLRTRGRHLTKIALVATRGRGFGSVKVYLGNRLLRQVSLAGRTLRKRRVVPIARFDRPRHGVVKVVVVSRGRVVRIEGLGLAHR